MVKAELELYEEQCNGVTKKLQEATASLKKIDEEKEGRQRCRRDNCNLWCNITCVCV